MFILLLSTSSFSLNEFLTSLSDQAHLSAKRPRASFPHPTEYHPGHYDFGTVSFSLSHPLIGIHTSFISGFASSHSVLALISPPIRPDTIFVDADTQTLLQITNPFLSDRDATFYNVTSQNPLSVFTNLKMRTSAFESGFNCSASLSSASAQCRAFAKFNWDEAQNRPTPIQISNSIELLIGAFLEVIGSAQVSFNGLQNVNLDYSFSFDGRLGAGIRINESLVYQFPRRDPFSFVIWGWDRSFLGFTLTLALKGYVGVSVREIEVEIPEPIEYYRLFQAIVKKQGSLSTKSGFTNSPLVYELSTNGPQKLDPGKVFEALAELKLNIKPELYFGVEVEVVVGPLVNYDIKLGVVIESVWTFSLNAESCPCPYLFGQTVTNMKFYVDSQDLKLFGYALLRKFYLEFPIFSGFETPGQCIFSPQKSKEGISWLRFDENVPSYIITGFEFTKGGFELGAWDFKPAIQALTSSGAIFQDLQLANINWGISLGWSQTATRNGRMVVTLPSGGSIRWYGYQAIFWIPQTATADLDRTPGPHTTGIGSLANVEYNVARAQNIDIFKEFPGTDNAYVSFKPSVPSGSLLGAIVHSVIGEAAYSAPILEEVFDDSRLDSNAKEFLGKDQVDLDIISFRPVQASTARLTFKRGSSEIKVALANNLVPGVPVPNPFDISQVTVDLSDGNPLTIEFLLARSENDHTTDTLTISHDELSTGTNFTLERSSDNFDLTFHVVRTQPNVVFQFRQPLSLTQRAIVCRVTEGARTDSRLILQPTECYGILRFLNVPLFASESLIALVSMPGLTPLCEHRQLDSDRLVIPLINGLTLFERNIHIPFRRASGGFNTTVRLDDVLATTEDGLCGSGVRITIQSSGPVACFESVVNDGTDIAGWTALSRSNRSARTMETDSGRSTISGTGWRLHKFQVPAGSVDLFPSTFTMPEDAVSMQLPQSAVRSFADAGTPISVKCDRATWIERTCGSPPEVLLAERAATGSFEVVPCAETDLLITAVCKDSGTAFCKFTVKLESRTLLKYGNASGVFEIGVSAETSGALLPGISRQVIGPRGPVQAYKDWSGSISEGGVIEKAAKLKVRAKVTGERVEVSLMFGELEVPFSAEKYYADPEGFFKELGIGKPQDGYRPEVVNFTDSANVEVANKSIDLAVLRGGINVERTTDLPKELVTGQEFVLEEQQLEEKGVNVGAIVGGSVGGVVVIVGVVVGIVIWKRRKAESDSDFVDTLEP